MIPSSKNFEYFPKFGDSKKLIKKKAILEAKKWLNLWSKIDKNVVQTTFDPPIVPAMGNEDSVSYGGKLHFIRLVNSLLIERLPSHVSLIDIESLVTSNQGSSWSDTRLFFLTKQPFSMETIVPLVNSISGKIMGKLGLSKKVIVLDLDNTLWGGIAGDDGIEGINLDINSPDGEAFLEFQKYLKSLSDNGIILCISSKNDEKIVKKIFNNHKKIVLKLKDFTIIKANFDDKVKNIKEISKTLNLSLDSFIFIDDSKIECSLVKKKLPEVFVINLDSSEPYNYIKEVESHNLFYFKDLTSADLNRKNSYKKIENLNKIKLSSSNLESFLKGLNPIIKLDKINNLNIVRVAQLLAKTNQFKFNNNLYSEKELKKIKENVIVVSFRDNTQDYGIIGVLIIKDQKSILSIEIKNWVISCRVFSRRIENYILDYLLKKLQKIKYKFINFTFVFSEKNKYLQSFLREINIKLSSRKKNILLQLTKSKI